MANISITTACNQHCDYCFARPPRKSEEASDVHMGRDMFLQVLDFLERSNINQVRLLGGEPTLHPDFPLFAQQALDRGLSVLVFSNGLMPQRALKWLEASPIGRVSVLINITNLGADRIEPTARQSVVLSKLARKVILGVNIDSPAINLIPLLQLIERHRLLPVVRLGLAHPRVNGGNRFLHPRDYFEVGRGIADFAIAAREKGVRLEFDCGFVPCMFPCESHEVLEKQILECGLRCNPIPDVFPDGRVVSCLPLADLHQEVLGKSFDATWLRARFESTLTLYRSIALYRDCAACSFYRSGHCLGGCLAASLQRLRRLPFEVKIPKDALRAQSSSVHDKWRMEQSKI